MVSPRFTILLFGVPLCGALSFAPTAKAQQNWSQYYPPAVQVASLEDLNNLEQSREQKIAHAAHLEPMPTSAGDPQDIQWSEAPPLLSPGGYDSLGASYLPAPPHRVIQAPRATPAPNARTGDAPYNAAYPAPYHVPYDTPPLPGNPAAGIVPPASHLPRTHHLPELPGVENDPSSVGPGHLGIGTHWLKTRPQARPTIPNATVAPTWKTPYSYGYFGSEGKRHWTRQNGYRDRSLQWTLR